ncbi:MAG: hypothetical protein JNN13_12850 [Planctomycetes bacterium]|nr:hypothetical protein [Planctomycetota bacterium]
MSAPDRRDDERFAEWVDGCMSGRDRERFEAELRVNARLRADLEAYERTVASVQAALRAPTTEVDFADRVLARLAATRAPAPILASPPRRPWLLAMVLVAALLGVMVWISSWQPTSSGLDVAKVADVVPTAPSPPASEAPAGQSGGGGGGDVGMRRLDAAGGAVPPEAKAAVVPADSDEAGERREQSAAPTRLADAAPVPSVAVPTVGGPDAKAPAEPQPTAPEAASAATAVPGAERRDGAPSAVRSAAPQPDADLEAGDERAKRKAAEEHLESGEVAETLAPTELVPEIVVTGTVPAARRGRGSPAVGGEPKGPVAGGAAPAPAGPTPGLPAGPATGGPAGPASGGPVRTDRFGGSKNEDRGAPLPTGGKRAVDLGSEVEQFLAAQIAAPAKDARASDWAATAGTLRLTVLVPEVRKADAGAGDDAEAAGGERAWLVEGSKDEVAAVVARLGVLVRRQQLQMNNGETRLASPPALAGEKVRDETAKVVPAAPAAARVRLVLRLRLTQR